MDILGLNAFHADSSAVLLRDGSLVSALEEERLNRVKHWSGFPARAVGSVLEAGGVALSGVPHVAVSRDPRRHLLRRLFFVLRRRPQLAAVRSRLLNVRQVADLSGRLRGLDAGFAGRIHHVEHHRAHLASAFYCSPFAEAACLTVDGFGDFVSSMSAIGKGTRLEVLDEVPFPHSLGVFYTAVTQLLGFPHYGDEYKVMALGSFGRPRFAEPLRRVVRATADGRFQTDTRYFRHATEGVTMSWDDGQPVLGPLWSPRLAAEVLPARAAGEPLTEVHFDLAASLQQVFEEVLLARLRWLQRRTGLRALCLAGGCALNSVANGRLPAEAGFTDLFVQPAAGDAGTALGAAQYVWHHEMGKERTFTMDHVYWGPGYTEDRLRAALEARFPGFAAAGQVDGVRLQRAASEEALLGETARALAGGAIVGWFQGRTEWGPRALGNRSILADPRRPETKAILNARIKRREDFRPFAPSILLERVGDYFEPARPDPFMVTVLPLREEKRGVIPAAAHVDGTGRLHTVERTQNPRYWALLKAFEKETGVPVLVNTSFNDNEPIVNTPEEAIDCFLRTRMDRLVLGDWVLERVAGWLA